MVQVQAQIAAHHINKELKQIKAGHGAKWQQNHLTQFTTLDNSTPPKLSTNFASLSAKKTLKL